MNKMTKQCQSRDYIVAAAASDADATNGVGMRRTEEPAAAGSGDWLGPRASVGKGEGGEGGGERGEGVQET